MKKIRIIIASNAGASIEQVYFTEDTESPATDFFLSHMDIDSDTVTEMVLPDAFPLNYILTRE